MILFNSNIIFSLIKIPARNQRKVFSLIMELLKVLRRHNRIKTFNQLIDETIMANDVNEEMKILIINISLTTKTWLQITLYYIVSCINVHSLSLIIIVKVFVKGFSFFFFQRRQ